MPTRRSSIFDQPEPPKRQVRSPRGKPHTQNSTSSTSSTLQFLGQKIPHGLVDLQSRQRLCIFQETETKGWTESDGFQVRKSEMSYVLICWPSTPCKRGGEWKVRVLILLEIRAFELCAITQMTYIVYVTIHIHMFLYIRQTCDSMPDIYHVSVLSNPKNARLSISLAKSPGDKTWLSDILELYWVSDSLATESYVAGQGLRTLTPSNAMLRDFGPGSFDCETWCLLCVSWKYTVT